MKMYGVVEENLHYFLALALYGGIDVGYHYGRLETVAEEAFAT